MTWYTPSPGSCSRRRSPETTRKRPLISTVTASRATPGSSMVPIRPAQVPKFRPLPEQAVKWRDVFQIGRQTERALGQHPVRQGGGLFHVVRDRQAEQPSGRRQQQLDPGFAPEGVGLGRGTGNAEPLQTAPNGRHQPGKPDQYGHVARGERAAGQILGQGQGRAAQKPANAFAHPAGLARGGRRLEELDVPEGRIGPPHPGDQGRPALKQPAGQVQDRLGRTVVLRQADDLEIGPEGGKIGLDMAALLR